MTIKLKSNFSIQSLIIIKKKLKKKKNLKKKNYFLNYKSKFLDSFVNQYFKRGLYLKFYKLIKKNYNLQFLKQFKVKQTSNNYTSYIIKNYKQVNDLDRFFFFKFKKFSLNFYEKRNKVKVLTHTNKNYIIFKYLILFLKITKTPIKKQIIPTLNSIMFKDDMGILNNLKLQFYKKQLISIKLTN